MLYVCTKIHTYLYVCRAVASTAAATGPLELSLAACTKIEAAVLLVHMACGVQHIAQHMSLGRKVEGVLCLWVAYFGAAY